MLHEVTKDLKTSKWELTLAGRIRLQPFPESAISAVLDSQAWKSGYPGWGRLITMLKQECNGRQVSPNWKLESSLMQHHGLTSEDSPTKSFATDPKKAQFRPSRKDHIPRWRELSEEDAQVRRNDFVKHPDAEQSFKNMESLIGKEMATQLFNRVLTNLRHEEIMD